MSDIMGMLLLAIPGILGLALVAGGLYLLFSRRPPPSAGEFYTDYPRRTVVFGPHAFRAAIADTVIARTRGLSGCEFMADDEAMLFEFPIAMKHSFWMKGMKFPLDIIWMKSGLVVDISENVLVSPVVLISPKVPTDAVLEVNAGLARKFAIAIGDKAEVAGGGQVEK